MSLRPIGLFNLRSVDIGLHWSGPFKIFEKSKISQPQTISKKEHLEVRALTEMLSLVRPVLINIITDKVMSMKTTLHHN